PEGELFNWTLTRLKQLGPNGFRAMLWHQGESDADKMKEEDYAAKLSTTLDGWRKQAGWDFPVFVAQASFRPWGGNSAAVRAAQQSLWDKKIAYPGPDTDAMLGDLRDNDGKGIHFSLKGLKVHGEAWAEKVGAYLDRVGLASIGATKPENAEVVAEPSERAPK
ncbi:MAG TPA: sialate O-acetylesterase, partial [Luteolibacter sp.]